MRLTFGTIDSKEVAMKVKVDEGLCTGCGLCAETCPEIFELENDISMVKIGDDDVPRQYENACQDAADSCPVEAIQIE